jgi:hypothetical protein
MSQPDITMSDAPADDPAATAAMEQSLTSLMTYLELLQQQPRNIPLIEETVSLARKCGMGEQVESGLEMLVRNKGSNDCEFPRLCCAIPELIVCVHLSDMA